MPQMLLQIYFSVYGSTHDIFQVLQTKNSLEIQKLEYLKDEI